MLVPVFWTVALGPYAAVTARKTLCNNFHIQKSRANPTLECSNRFQTPVLKALMNALMRVLSSLKASGPSSLA
jgi:hypothetical protein